MVILVSSITIAQPTIFTHSRSKNSEISFSKIQKMLSSYPTLISSWGNNEVIKGDLKLVRTDGEEPDGILFVFLKDKLVCKIELSLMPDIFYNSKDKYILIYGYSGSESFIELFSLRNECKYLGEARLNPKKDWEVIKNNWCHQSDQGEICNK